MSRPIIKHSFRYATGQWLDFEGTCFSLKGTGFSPYINHAKMRALAPEGILLQTATTAAKKTVPPPAQKVY